MRKISFKFSSEILSIRNVKCSLALLHVFDEVSLIFYPTCCHFINVFPIDGVCDIDRCLVVKYSIPMKLVLTPLPLICQLVINIIECPSTLHFVFVPLATVLPSFFIVECAKAVSHSIFLIPFIFAPAVLLCYIIWPNLAWCSIIVIVLIAFTI